MRVLVATRRSQGDHEIEWLTADSPVGAIVRRDGQRYRADTDPTDAPSDAA